MNQTSSRSKNNRFVQKYLLLRRLIAFLGEKNQFNWWSTSALSPTGTKYHSMLFPRTNGLAAFNQTTQSACHHHDQSLSRSLSYHLFRLPNELEESIYRGASNSLPGPSDLTQETALSELEALAGESDYNADGPIQLGGLGQIRSSKSIESIAGYYLEAFRSGKTIIPFFADA